MPDTTNSHPSGTRCGVVDLETGELLPRRLSPQEALAVAFLQRAQAEFFAALAVLAGVVDASKYDAIEYELKNAQGYLDTARAILGDQTSGGADR